MNTSPRELLEEAVFIWGQGKVAETLGVERETVNRWLNKKDTSNVTMGVSAKDYRSALNDLLPKKSRKIAKFTFIDLFAGIGGLRMAFESIGGSCKFTSEWNEQAQRTYRANFHCDHPINGDIREITEARALVEGKTPKESEIEEYIQESIPDHDVLLAGFPCQPFSIAGVSKKNAMGRAHGFDCKIQGTLFFDICKIIKAKRPACFVLENVKNLKSHNKGDTYKTILQALRDLGYNVPEPNVISSADYVPQGRERIVIVGFRDDLDIESEFCFSRVKPKRGHEAPRLGALLDSHNEVDSKYTLTPKLWEYLYNYKKGHRSKGNGFGYDIFTPDSTCTRTLSARYYKDGSEILIARNEKHKEECENFESRPRRLTPRECARLMGFDDPMRSKFKIPVSDTQAYKQFGNSVVVPMFASVARAMLPSIKKAVAKTEQKTDLTIKPRQNELEMNVSGFSVS